MPTTIKYCKLTRVRLTGPMAEVKDAIDFCVRNGYEIRRSGPRRTSVSRCDPTRFKIVAYREED